MVYDRRPMDAYEDLMSAAVFAQAGEFKTAKEIMHEQEIELKAEADKLLKALSSRYVEIADDLNYQIAVGDAFSSIKEFLKNKPNIDMVLISPSLSKSKQGIDLKKLINKISKPVVTISQPLQAGA
jgi:2-hydroxy-3-keto-5-methylthiopentenyl-1-phosphate phosphatase